MSDEWSIPSYKTCATGEWEDKGRWEDGERKVRKDRKNIGRILKMIVG